jgi:penicillin-binding protein 2
MVTLIAAMESDVFQPGETIYDAGKYMKYANEGFYPTCLAWKYGISHGDCDAAKALEKSCNYFFYELGDRLSINVLDNVAKKMGLGEPTGVELAEDVGQRANKEVKKALYIGFDSGWFTADQILAAIGQSINRFTPMQLCVYATTLANRGVRRSATFMNRVVSSDYRELLEENKPELLSHMEISDEAYEAYSEGMYLVTQNNGDWGTAAGTFGDYPIKIAAKTGTAETGIHGTSANGAFVCYAPLEDPQIAIAIYVEKGGHGSSLATIAKSMLDVYFDVDEVGDVNSFENAIS